MEKELHIKEVKNGYTISLCVHDMEEGGMMGGKHEEYILKEVPAEVKAWFKGKFEGKKIDTPDSRKKSFDKAEEEANEAPEKEESEED